MRKQAQKTADVESIKTTVSETLAAMPKGQRESGYINVLADIDYQASIDTRLKDIDDRLAEHGVALRLLSAEMKSEAAKTEMIAEHAEEKADAACAAVENLGKIVTKQLDKIGLRSQWLLGIIAVLLLASIAAFGVWHNSVLNLTTRIGGTSNVRTQSTQNRPDTTAHPVWALPADAADRSDRGLAPGSVQAAETAPGATRQR